MFFFFLILLIYLFTCCAGVFVALHRLSLVATSRVYSSVGAQLLITVASLVLERRL